jgi:hypothetical protein
VRRDVPSSSRIGRPQPSRLLSHDSCLLVLVLALAVQRALASVASPARLTAHAASRELAVSKTLRSVVESACSRPCPRGGYRPNSADATWLLGSLAARDSRQFATSRIQLAFHRLASRSALNFDPPAHSVTNCCKPPGRVWTARPTLRRVHPHAQPISASNAIQCRDHAHRAHALRLAHLQHGHAIRAIGLQQDRL